jgi:hypothetical protein
VCGSGAVVSSWSLLIRWAQRARCQAETPLIVLFRFLRPALTDDQLAVQVLRSSILDLLAEAGVVRPMMRQLRGILEIANSLFERSGLLGRADRQRRMDMAHLFESISGCLAAVSREIRAGKEAYARCDELHEYGLALPDKIREEMGSDRAEQLGNTLRSAHFAREFSLGHLGGDVARREPYLQVIEEASGKFQALANLVKVR